MPNVKILLNNKLIIQDTFNKQFTIGSERDNYEEIDIAGLREIRQESSHIVNIFQFDTYLYDGLNEKAYCSAFEIGYLPAHTVSIFIASTTMLSYWAPKIHKNWKLELNDKIYPRVSMFPSLNLVWEKMVLIQDPYRVIISFNPSEINQSAAKYNFTRFGGEEIDPYAK